jgi:hypothetical protein
LLLSQIAIVRYGKIYRGNKVDEAQKAGAAGCIIYSGADFCARIDARAEFFLCRRPR